MRFKNCTLLLVLQMIFIQSTAIASYLPIKTFYQVCFTPGQDCTQLIVDEINHAKNSVYVQAYSFTSAPIASAIVDAKKRGLDVKVILDKSQIKNNKYSSAKFLINNHIETWIDNKPAIAHNKIMIIDHAKVLTGSFNFTKSAQTRNAENLLIIENSDLANTYYSNWLKRKEISLAPQDYLDRHKF